MTERVVVAYSDGVIQLVDEGLRNHIAKISGQVSDLPHKFSLRKGELATVEDKKIKHMGPRRETERIANEV